MAVDPYVPASHQDAPRLRERIPPPRGWRADRPGEIGPEGPPKGDRFGLAGPDAGYALTLAERVRPRLVMTPGEHADDAVAAAAGLAMRRAALRGRAPVLADLELAFTILGYLGDAPADLLEWRRHRVEGAAHREIVVTGLVGEVPQETLRLEAAEARLRLGEWRRLLGAADDPTAGGH